MIRTANCVSLLDSIFTYKAQTLLCGGRAAKLYKIWCQVAYYGVARSGLLASHSYALDAPHAHTHKMSKYVGRRPHAVTMGSINTPRTPD